MTQSTPSLTPGEVEAFIGQAVPGQVVTDPGTTFSGALCKASSQAEAVRAMLAFMASPDAEAAKRRNGMEPAA